MSLSYSALFWRLLKCSPLVVFSDPAFAVGEFVAPAWPLSDCFDIWSGEQCWMEMLINSHKCILVQVHVLPCIFVLVLCDFFCTFFHGQTAWVYSESGRGALPHLIFVISFALANIFTANIHTNMAGLQAAF